MKGWISKQPNPLPQHISSAIDMLITMLIKDSSLSKVYERKEVERAIYLIGEWSKEDADLERNYRCLWELFENDRKVKKYLIERDSYQIKRFF